MAKKQPRKRLEQEVVIAIDLGGTKIAAANFAIDARPQRKRTALLDGRQGIQVADAVIDEVHRLLRSAAQDDAVVRAVGISVPGIVDPRQGTVWAPNLPGWDNYPLGCEVKKAIDNANIAVVIDSDRAASILGEVWQGTARGCRDAIFLAVGTGIGAGILVDGRVLQGAHGIAGAIGWLALDRPFKPEYAACGCFESHASGIGLARQAAAAVGRQTTYSGPLRTEQALTAHSVFEAYQHGDPIAQKVLAEAVEFWAMASANLVSLFNPEKIIFGGGVFGPAAQFIDAIAAEARRWAQPISIERVTFEQSQLGSDAALYGLAYLALRDANLVPPT